MSDMTIRAAIEAHALELAAAVWGEQPAATKPEAGGLWHVVRRIGKSERQADLWLTRLQIPHYQPMMRELRPVARKHQSRAQRALGHSIMRPRLTALFPGYLFIRLDRTRDSWDQVRDVAGVAGLVCAGGQPVVVPETLVGGWRSREVDRAVPGETPARLVFGLGDRVRISDGPFAERTATVDKLFDMPIADIDEHTRISVAIDILGRPVPVALGLDQIEWRA